MPTCLSSSICSATITCTAHKSRKMNKVFRMTFMRGAFAPCITATGWPLGTSNYPLRSSHFVKTWSSMR